MWKWLIPLSVVPVVLLLAYGFRTNPREIPSPLVGRPAAPFALRSFDGTPVTLESLKGRVVVLNFWASWCYPACYEEAPALERAWRAYRDRGVTVIGVAIQDREEASRKFIADFSLSFPNAPDPGGKVSIDYGVYGVPETFFIDRAGRIRRKHAGAITDELFRAEAEKLLGEVLGGGLRPPSEPPPRTAPAKPALEGAPPPFRTSPGDGAGKAGARTAFANRG